MFRFLVLVRNFQLAQQLEASGLDELIIFHEWRKK